MVQSCCTDDLCNTEVKGKCKGRDSIIPIRTTSLKIRCLKNTSTALEGITLINTEEPNSVVPTWKEKQSENLTLRVLKSGGWTPQPVTKVPRRGETIMGCYRGNFEFYHRKCWPLVTSW